MGEVFPSAAYADRPRARGGALPALLPAGMRAARAVPGPAQPRRAGGFGVVAALLSPALPAAPEPPPPLQPPSLVQQFPTSRPQPRTGVFPDCLWLLHGSRKVHKWFSVFPPSGIGVTPPRNAFCLPRATRLRSFGGLCRLSQNKIKSTSAVTI